MFVANLTLRIKKEANFFVRKSSKTFYQEVQGISVVIINKTTSNQVRFIKDSFLLILPKRTRDLLTHTFKLRVGLTAMAMYYFTF